MQHKTLEAKATATDLGEFTAIAAAYSVDRANERIVPGAFAATIASWQSSGKQIPLHWDHSGNPADIIGTVDPQTMRETADGLEVKGQLDLKDSEVAREAWRLMRNNAASLSFGYLVTDEAEAEDGVLELKAIDLFEITITPAPANADTRVLSMKSVKDLTPEEMRGEIGVMRDRLDQMEQAIKVKDLPEPAPDGQDAPDEEPPEGPTPKASPPVGRTQIDNERDEGDLLLLDAKGGK